MSELLRLSLAAAVPLWIERLRSMSTDERMQRGKACGEIVAHEGDVILFRGGKRGETAQAFNALAQGIAALAYSPGGVEVFGMRFVA